MWYSIVPKRVSPSSPSHCSTHMYRTTPVTHDKESKTNSYPMQTHHSHAASRKTYKQNLFISPSTPSPHTQCHLHLSPPPTTNLSHHVLHIPTAPHIRSDTSNFFLERRKERNHDIFCIGHQLGRGSVAPPPPPGSFFRVPPPPQNHRERYVFLCGGFGVSGFALGR